MSPFGPISALSSSSSFSRQLFCALPTFKNGNEQHRGAGCAARTGGLELTGKKKKTRRGDEGCGSGCARGWKKQPPPTVIKVSKEEDGEGEPRRERGSNAERCNKRI